MQHRPKKRFGQNFLQDATVIHQIVDAIAPESDDLLVEIGPGLGALTRELLKPEHQVTTLHVVELDRDLAAHLPAHVGDPKQGHPKRLVIHQADALDFDFKQLQAENPQKPFKIVGNLPYNVATPLILRLVQSLPDVNRMVFMVQAEVADRLTAAPGNKDYGRLTLMTQYFCHIETLFTVPNHAFYPVPKVLSAVISCTPHHPLPYVAKDWTMFAQLVKQAFAQRRKTIANTLKNWVSQAQFRAAGIDSTLRPEQIALPDFVRLSNLMA